MDRSCSTYEPADKCIKLTKLECEGVDWIQLTKVSVHCRVF
jgi:hypothetical protein